MLLAGICLVFIGLLPEMQKKERNKIYLSQLQFSAVRPEAVISLLACDPTLCWGVILQNYT